MSSINVQRHYFPNEGITTTIIHILLNPFIWVCVYIYVCVCVCVCVCVFLLTMHKSVQMPWDLSRFRTYLQLPHMQMAQEVPYGDCSAHTDIRKHNFFTIWSQELPPTPHGKVIGVLHDRRDIGDVKLLYHQTYFKRTLQVCTLKAVE